MAEQFVPTTTPEATGGVGAVEEVGAQLNRANQWNQAFGLLGGVAKTAEIFTAEDKRRQAQTDMADASVFASQKVQEVSQMPIEDQFTAYEEIVNGVQSGTSDKSETYNRTLLNSILPKYTSTGIERKRQLVETDLRMSTDTMMLDAQNRGSFGDVPAMIKETASRLNIDVSRARDATYGSYYAFFQDRVSGVTDEDELNTILGEMAISDKALNSPQLLGNSSTGASGDYLKSQKSAFASTVKQVRGVIQKARKTKAALYTNENDPEIRGRFPGSMNETIDLLDSPEEKQEYRQKKMHHDSVMEEANNFDTENDTTFHTKSKDAQAIIKQDITTSIGTNFDEFDGPTLSKTLISQKDNAGDGVKHILSQLNSPDELASANSFIKLQDLFAQSNGQEVKAVVFSNDDARTRYDAMVALQESGIIHSMAEAKDFMNQEVTAWKFDSKQEERSYNSIYEGIPVNLANRGKRTYNALRSRGASHDVAEAAAEKSIGAEADVGGVTIHGTENPFNTTEKVKSSIGTQLEAMTKDFGEDIVHSYDVWSDSIISTNEYGVIINTSNRMELQELSSKTSAFKRDAEKHYIKKRWERGTDKINSYVQDFVRLKGKDIVGPGDSFNEPQTPDLLWNFMTRSIGPSSYARRKREEEESKSTFMNGGKK